LRTLARPCAYFRAGGFFTRNVAGAVQGQRQEAIDSRLRPRDAACLPKPHSASALVAALRAVETMTCKNKAPRKVSGLLTYWRPEAA